LVVVVLAMMTKVINNGEITCITTVVMTILAL